MNSYTIKILIIAFTLLSMVGMAALLLVGCIHMT